MREYEAIRDSVGFRKRRWRKGDTVEVDDDIIVPHHFKLISGYKKPEPVEEKPIALSELHNQVKPTSGFGYKAEEVAPKVIKTRGRPKKNDVGSVKK